MTTTAQISTAIQTRLDKNMSALDAVTHSLSESPLTKADAVAFATANEIEVKKSWTVKQIAQAVATALFSTENEIALHGSARPLENTTTKENDSMTENTATKPAAAKKAAPAPRAYKVPKGYEVKWQHGGHDLLKKSDAAAKGPAWYTACNAHGDLHEAASAKEAEGFGVLKVRSTWCKGDHAPAAKKTAPAKAAAKKTAAKAPAKAAAKKTAAKK